MFGAVTGILAAGLKKKISGVSQFFTSALYAIAVEESLAVGLPVFVAGYSFNDVNDYLELSVPGIEGGTLEETIHNAELSFGNTERLTLKLPKLVLGTLEETIAYQQYSVKDTEKLVVTIPKVLSGTLAVTVNYLTYSSGVNPLAISLPRIKSGTLS